MSTLNTLTPMDEMAVEVFSKIYHSVISDWEVDSEIDVEACLRAEVREAGVRDICLERIVNYIDDFMLSFNVEKDGVILRFSATICINKGAIWDHETAKFTLKQRIIHNFRSFCWVGQPRLYCNGVQILGSCSKGPFRDKIRSSLYMRCKEVDGNSSELFGKAANELGLLFINACRESDSLEEGYQVLPDIIKNAQDKFLDMGISVESVNKESASIIFILSLPDKQSKEITISFKNTGKYMRHYIEGLSQP